MLRKGYAIKVATICGGLSKCEVFVQTNSDVLQIEIIKPHQMESVLLGAAMLGAAAAHSDDATVSSKRYLDAFYRCNKNLAMLFQKFGLVCLLHHKMNLLNIEVECCWM